MPYSQVLLFFKSFGWVGEEIQGDLTFIHFRDLLEFLNNLWGLGTE
jgi:hypothetical protein